MKALGIVFSNIHDKELSELTLNRTIASVPFGGRYRLIDFVLSNFVNSGISKVGVITKMNYQSLMDHIGSGKHWDLSRKKGGLMVLPPFGAGGAALYTSRFEALKNIGSFIRRSDEEYVVMSDCDNVCNMDFSKVVNDHIKNCADITIVYRKKVLEPDDKKNRLFVELGKDRRATRFVESSRLTGETNVCVNVLVLNRKFLLSLLEDSRANEIQSFKKDVLIRGVNEFKIFGYEYTGYFASIDSVENYFKHSMELLDVSNRKRLFDNDGANIFTKVRDSAPLKMGEGAVVSNSLIADGCEIYGTVRNSILFRGVKVAKDVVINNSIIFQDSVICKGSSINCVICDKQAMIKENRTLSGHQTRPYLITKNCVI